MQKPWVENAIKKIAMLEDCALVLFALGEIMYSCGCPIDVDAILWAKQEITYQQQGTPILPTS
jgi:hypothetical protein